MTSRCPASSCGAGPVKLGIICPFPRADWSAPLEMCQEYSICCSDKTQVSGIRSVLVTWGDEHGIESGKFCKAGLIAGGSLLNRKRLCCRRPSILGLPVMSPYALLPRMWSMLMLLIDMSYTAYVVPIGVGFSISDTNWTWCAIVDFTAGSPFLLAKWIYICIWLVCTSSCFPSSFDT